MTSDAPHRNAAYGMPHALAWNIGTIMRMRSRSDRSSALRRESPRTSAGTTTGASTRHPSGCRWCPTCNTWPRPGVRRSRATSNSGDSCASSSRVAQDRPVGAERGRVAVADDDEALDRRQLGHDLGEHRHERVVDEHDLVLAVIDRRTRAARGTAGCSSVWSTAPIDGIARYASMCSCEFHMNVPTRSPVVHAEPGQRVGEPARVGGDRRRRSRAGGPVSVQVTHSASAYTVLPWRSTAVMVSGKSCIVLEITSPSSVPRARAFVPAVFVASVTPYHRAPATAATPTRAPRPKPASIRSARRSPRP